MTKKHTCCPYTCLAFFCKVVNKIIPVSFIFFITLAIYRSENRNILPGTVVRKKFQYHGLQAIFYYADVLGECLKMLPAGLGQDGFWKNDYCKPTVPTFQCWEEILALHRFRPNVSK